MWIHAFLKARFAPQCPASQTTRLRWALTRFSASDGCLVQTNCLTKCPTSLIVPKFLLYETTSPAAAHLVEGWPSLDLRNSGGRFAPPRSLSQKKESCWARCLCVPENEIVTVAHLRKPSFASLLKTSFAATPCCALPPRIQRSAMLSPASWCLRCVRPRDAPSGSRLGFAGLMHFKKRSSPREAPPCKRLDCARLLYASSHLRHASTNDTLG